jgi:hypothetical protein
VQITAAGYTADGSDLAGRMIVVDPDRNLVDLAAPAESRRKRRSRVSTGSRTVHSAAVVQNGSGRTFGTVWEPENAGGVDRAGTKAAVQMMFGVVTENSPIAGCVGVPA